MSRLVEPTSVTAASCPAAASAAAASSGSRPTGAAQKTISAPAQASRDVAGDGVGGADGERRLAGRRVRVVARDHGAEPLPRRQPDRAADQPDAEDGDPRRVTARASAVDRTALMAPPQARRAWTAEANRSSAWTVSSQPRQASVIDWP